MLNALSFSAAAQSVPDDHTMQITAPSFKIELPAHYRHMRQEDFSDFIRSYDLSNGMTLDLFQRGGQMYAAVSGQDRHEIVAVAPNTFVALDRQLKMTINLPENADANGELIMVVPAHSMAGGGVASEQLMRVALR
jgi:hypothetical protein